MTRRSSVIPEPLPGDVYVIVSDENGPEVYHRPVLEDAEPEDSVHYFAGPHHFSECWEDIVAWYSDEEMSTLRILGNTR